MVDLTKLKNPMTWPKSRKEIEGKLVEILGPVSKTPIDVQMKTVDEQDSRGYARRRVNYFVDGWERVSAWLFVPNGKDEAPAILCCHQECPQGKDEPAGLGGDPRLAFAQRYAEMGYVTLAPDCITAGDRVSSRCQPYDGKSFYKDQSKLSLAGRMLADHMRAVDLFCELKRVDSARIGVAGHGLGGFNALLMAAMDDRVQACVTSCGFTRFATDKEPERWAPEEGLALMPKLKKCCESKTFPFDWEHILALAAPSATLVITSLTDSLYSNPRSCQKAVNQASRVYKLLGAAGALDHFIHHDGHQLKPETLELADEWFERWL